MRRVLLIAQGGRKGGGEEGISGKKKVFFGFGEKAIAAAAAAASERGLRLRRFCGRLGGRWRWRAQQHTKNPLQRADAAAAAAEMKKRLSEPTPAQLSSKHTPV